MRKSKAIGLKTEKMRNGSSGRRPCFDTVAALSAPILPKQPNSERREMVLRPAFGARLVARTRGSHLQVAGQDLGRMR